MVAGNHVIAFLFMQAKFMVMCSHFYFRASLDFGPDAVMLKKVRKGLRYFFSCFQPPFVSLSQHDVPLTDEVSMGPWFIPLLFFLLLSLFFSFPFPLHFHFLITLLLSHTPTATCTLCPPTSFLEQDTYSHLLISPLQTVWGRHTIASLTRNSSRIITTI